VSTPPSLAAIAADTARIGFGMGSDAEVGALLRTLAAARPGAAALELGAGTGLATCWLLDGLDATSSLTALELDPDACAVLGRHLGGDPRLSILAEDGDIWIGQNAQRRFDLIFADAMPGKYRHLDETVAMLAPGGLYVVDDMSPHPNWPDGHGVVAEDLRRKLETHEGLASVSLDVASGVIIAARRSS
jgi:predicted O-methyltransferase YrrM